MYVQRKQPLWPCLAPLFVLLIFCLASPRLWQVGHQGPAHSASVATPQKKSVEILCVRRKPLIFSTHSVAGGVQFFLPLEPPELQPAPLSATLVSVQTKTSNEVKASKPASLDNLFPGLDTSGALYDLGRWFAILQPEAVTRPVLKLISQHLARFPEPTVQPVILIRSSDEQTAPMFSLRPGVRVAMVPTRRQKAPQFRLRERPTAEDSPDKVVGRSTVSIVKNRPWSSPVSLVLQVKRLRRHPLSRGWAEQVLSELKVLQEISDPADREISRRFDSLNQLSSQARMLAESTYDESLATECLRAHYALKRRVDVWSCAHTLQGIVAAEPNARLLGTEQLRMALDQIKVRTAGSDQGALWRDYLFMNPLDTWVGGQTRLSLNERHRLAQRILARLTTGGLTGSQRKFVSTDPVAGLTDELRYWAEEYLDTNGLATNLETYEATGSPRMAREIARQRRRLAWSPRLAQREMAKSIDGHYRNANIRLAVTEEFLNQIFPQPEGTDLAKVHDCIVGTPVRGRSWTDTAVKVRLVPAEHHVRFFIEANGTAVSKTVAFGEGARLRSVGNTNFHARKLVAVTTDGLKQWPAEAEAENYSRLVRIRTNYDGVPFAGSWAKSEAMTQYRQKRARARREVESKVANKAKSRLDQSAKSYLHDVEPRIRQRIKSLDAKGIHVEPIDLKTSEKRAVIRLRIAGDEQLAAHTPRNRAPSDSLASLQLHQSVLVNATQALDLDGQRLTAVELHNLFTEQFPKAKANSGDDIPRDTIFHFEYEDAIGFRIADGQLEFTIALVELVHDGRSVRRFKVHAFYRPQIKGANVFLVRDGALGIEGRLRVVDRARMHAVFNKILPEEQQIPVIDFQLWGVPDPAGVMVTQAVLEDGWLGLALGPARPDRAVQLERSLR
jgi:hypothetical protein